MLLQRKPITMAEAKDLAGDMSEKKPIEEYLKNFTKLDKASAMKLTEEIRALGNMKIKEEDIVKIADFMPQDSIEVNKIFNEQSLSEEEIQSILNIVKNY